MEGECACVCVGGGGENNIKEGGPHGSGAPSGRLSQCVCVCACACACGRCLRLCAWGTLCVPKSNKQRKLELRHATHGLSSSC